MKSTMNKTLYRLTICLVIGVAANLTNLARAQENQFSDAFQLTSSTFANNSTLPIETIHNIISNNVNVCSIDGSVGQNESPALSWTNAPPGTRTFVVVDFDVTAAFTQWAMYNIPATTTQLPENAGVAGSPYGSQVMNDYFAAEQYDGPCPPTNDPPNNHRYVFTVYALDERLKLPGSADFLPIGETLYQALIVAGRQGHILASATLTGFYSTTPD